MYMNARYYEPGVARFLTPDSYTGNPYNPNTQNVYSYTGGNPVNYVDPTGHRAMLNPEIPSNIPLVHIELPPKQLQIGIIFVIPPMPEPGLTIDMLESGVAIDPSVLTEPGLEGMQVTQEGINNIQNHFDMTGMNSPENAAMMDRLNSAFSNGQNLTGADANFYLHEQAEASLMQGGLTYDAAHQQALDSYQASPYSIYHPDVIQEFSEYFNQSWFDFWGINK